MIRNLSYKNRELNAEIDNSIGKAYGFIQALKQRGTGSPRLRIHEASNSFRKYLPKIEHGEFCNIEIRPGGIILRFRYHLDNMGWIIPFHYLSIYKSEDYYSIHAEGEYLKVKAALNDVAPDNFFEKLQRLKSEKQFDQP